MFQEMLQVGSDGKSNVYNGIIETFQVVSGNAIKATLNCGFKPKYIAVVYKSTRAGLLCCEYDNGAEYMTYARTDTSSQVFRTQTSGLFSINNNGFEFTNDYIDTTFGTICNVSG